jgi:predicted metal-dependent peptidase
MELYGGSRRHLASGNWLSGIRRTEPERMDILALAIDISGSITRSQIKTFLTEVKAIRKAMKPKKTHIMWINQSITYTQTLTEKETDFNIPNLGGGTEFYPAFEWLEKNNIVPNAFIYLTDLYGNCPNPKSYNIYKYYKKVLWLCISRNKPGEMNGPKEPKFGKVLWVRNYQF